MGTGKMLSVSGYTDPLGADVAFAEINASRIDAVVVTTDHTVKLHFGSGEDWTKAFATEEEALAEAAEWTAAVEASR